MANTQYGNQDYIFGFDDPDAEAIAAAVGLKPQTLSIRGEPEFTADAHGATGLTESKVVADNKFTFTLAGFVVNRALILDGGTSFTYDGRFFIVMGNNLDIDNKDFQKGEVTGESYPQITS